MPRPTPTPAATITPIPLVTPDDQKVFPEPLSLVAARFAEMTITSTAAHLAPADLSHAFSVDLPPGVIVTYCTATITGMGWENGAGCSSGQVQVERRTNSPSGTQVFDLFVVLATAAHFELTVSVEILFFG